MIHFISESFLGYNKKLFFLIKGNSITGHINIGSAKGVNTPSRSKSFSKVFKPDSLTNNQREENILDHNKLFHKEALNANFVAVSSREANFDINQYPQLGSQIKLFLK
jgi:hypothetical protein